MRFGVARDTAEASLLAGLREPTQGLLLQLLLYKAVFMGSAFRDLAQRQPVEAVRSALLRIHEESAAEAAALALTMRAWDEHPASADGIRGTAEEARRRFLLDLQALKESVVDVGVAAAMAAPSDDLRRQLLALVDLDRKHADAIRRAIGSRTLEEKLVRTGPTAAEDVAGVRVARAPGESMARAIEREIARIEGQDARPVALVLSAHALRHARDEGIIDRATGRAYELPIDVDLGWRGECFAIETSERIAYAEILSAGRDPDHWP